MCNVFRWNKNGFVGAQYTSLCLLLESILLNSSLNEVRRSMEGAELYALAGYHKVLYYLLPCCFSPPYLQISLNWWRDEAGKRKNRERKREFLWFPVASDLCNHHAKVLMSKSTTQTQTGHTQNQHMHRNAHVHTQNELLTSELCGDLCSFGVC